MAIRPPREDLYRELGVERSASTDELAAAFRALAKELHPDARTPGAAAPDSAADERFKRVSLAYSVLGDPARRARYDADGAVPAAVPGGATSPSGVQARARATSLSVGRGVIPAAPRRFTLGRAGARWALGGGIVLVALGVVAGAWVVALQRRDADLRERGVAAVATVVVAGGERRLEFTTRAGDVVQATEATKNGAGGPRVGSEVRIHYDARDPSRIVVDTSHTARNVTLWVVAVKFLVGGMILAAVGARRLLRRPSPA